MDLTPETLVFLSTCDGTLDDRLDIEALKERIASTANLPVLESPSWSGSEGRREMAGKLRSSGVGAVVVAGPAPSMAAAPPWVGVDDESAVRVESANIREQCAWVHPDPAVATAKAERLVRIAMARASRAGPLRIVDRPVNRAVAVLGRGAEAYTVAENLAAAGVEVLVVPPDCVERPLRPVADDERARIEKLPGVSVSHAGRVTALDGSVGGFRLTVGTNGDAHTLEVGAVVCAMDAIAAPAGTPESLAGHEGVISLDAFEGSTGDDAVCVRLDLEPGAHKLDARRAIDALIEHVGRGGRGSVLYQNMPVFGRTGQARYDEARLAGVQFIRVVAEPPVFGVEGGRIRIVALDEVLPERPIAMVVDRLVLPGSVRPAEGYRRLSAILAQPLDEEGFLQPSNVRHAPTAAARRGVFFCGRCHEDTDDEGSALEAEALVSHVLGVLPPEGTVRLPEEVVTVDVSRCVSCLTCLRLCPHGAIAMRDEGEGHSVTISDTACFECGICAAACPRQAITHGGLSNEQLGAAAEVAAEPFLGRQTLVVFACSQGAVQAADGAGRMGLELPAGAMIIEVPCAGRVSEVHIMNAFVAGAGGVVVLGCHPHNCRSLHGSDAARHRAARTMASLEAMGMDPDRVQYHSIAANEGARLAHILERAADAMSEE